MNELEIQNRKNYIRKLVSNTRAILSCQIGLSVGILKMNKIIYWINQKSPLENIDLNLFSEVYEKIRDYPLGTERLNCNKDYLINQDRQLYPTTLGFVQLDFRNLI